MLGYKIATYVIRDDDGSYYAVHRKVLVVLDIPDDVKRTTPEMRYNNAPLGYTTNELNDWAGEARKYKKYTDTHTLFREFKDHIDEWAMGTGNAYLLDPYDFYKSYIHVRKCRAAKAKVVKIIGLTDGTHYDLALSDFDIFTTYQTGETVTPDTYTDDYLNICAHGIHYFESPELALLYYAKDLSPTEASVFLNHADELLEKLRKEGDI